MKEFELIELDLIPIEEDTAEKKLNRIALKIEKLRERLLPRKRNEKAAKSRSN